MLLNSSAQAEGTVFCS